LSSVGEVVVSGVHVVEGSSGVHLDQTSIEVWASSVELHAVGSVLLNSGGIVVVGGQQFLHGLASSLSKHGEVESEFGGIEQGGVGVQPFSGGGERRFQIGDLDHVGSIGLISSFSGVSSGVGVTSGPLEVNVISRSDREISGDEIVLSGGVGLNDVSSLSSDVQVEDSVGHGDSSGSGSDMEHERSILEGSSELRMINGKSHVGSGSIISGVLHNGGSLSVHAPVNESRIGSVSVGTQIGGGDVVSDSESTVAVVVSNASKVGRGGESPVVLVGVTSISSVSEEVVSGEGSLDAIGSRDSVSGDFSPVQTSSRAISLVVGGSLNSSGGADESRLDVVRFSSVEIAVIHVGDHDGDINPWDGGPVRIVVSLLSAFVSVSVGIVVLSGVGGSVSSQVSIIDPETLVSVSGGTSLVVSVVLVHSVGQFSVGGSGGSSSVVGNGVSGNSISNQIDGISIRVGADVLENDVANQLLVDSATVLSSPLNGQERTLIERHGGSVAESSLSIVLGVEQSVGVVSISVGFIQSIIATSRVLHVHIGIGNSQGGKESSDELHPLLL